MARPRDYTPVRRRIMQGVMWVIFAATYAGATMLTHERTAAQRVPLGEPIKRGDLMLRLPKGWEVAVEQHRLVAKEPEGEGHFGRQIEVRFYPLGEPATPDEVLATLVGQPVRTKPFNFKYLGKGIMANLPPMTVEANEEIVAMPPRLCACVVVAVTPHSQAVEAVTIKMAWPQPAMFGPSNIALMQDIADSMVLTPDGATATAVEYRPHDGHDPMYDTSAKTFFCDNH